MRSYVCPSVSADSTPAWQIFVVAIPRGKTSRRFDGLCAMFDEVDEGTAIFKCANNVPVGENSKFITFDGLPSDYYLKMVGASAKLIRGESLTEAMPGGLSFSSQSNGAVMLNIP